METNFIPKIEFNRKTLVGTTVLASTTINTGESTTLFKVGMRVYSDQFPYDTTVVSKTVSTIEVSSGATSAVTNGNIIFNEFIDFELPPKGDTFGESMRHVGTTNTSKSGESYTFTDYIDVTHKITFSHFTQSIKEDLFTFLKEWGFLGKSFYYYDDKDEPNTETEVEINPSAKRNTFKIVARSGEGRSFKWSTSLNFRERV